jgi:hypothetical protein
MKLTSIEIHPSNSAPPAVLSFRDPGSLNPYNVKAIVGLDSDSIVPQHYGPGSPNFYNLSLQNRQIVIRVGLNPDFNNNQSYSDLRDDLYKMIAASRFGSIQLQFKNLLEVVAAITGYISKFEAPQFEKTQEVQITIQCSEPMLKALERDYVAGLDPVQTIIRDDKSTAPHGFTFNMAVNFAIASIEITDPNDTTWRFLVTPIGGFMNGDQLYFSSEYNNKELYIIRGGVDTIHLGDVISADSVWPIIFPGENTFSFTNHEYLRWEEISFYPTYWGV